MGQFIKLPKSATDLTNFDLMNVSSGVCNITIGSGGGGNTQILVEILGGVVGDAESLPTYTVTVAPAMSDLQQLDMIQNMSQAVQDAAQEPNSIPSLSMVNGVLVTSLGFTHAT